MVVIWKLVELYETKVYKKKYIICYFDCYKGTYRRSGFFKNCVNVAFDCTNDINFHTKQIKMQKNTYNNIKK